VGGACFFRSRCILMSCTTPSVACVHDEDDQREKAHDIVTGRKQEKERELQRVQTIKGRE
jgi:hypothetical protein